MLTKLVTKHNSFSSRTFTRSSILPDYYKFKLKTFNDIKIGDVISNPDDKNLYVILNKEQKDDVDKQVSSASKYLEVGKISSLKDKYQYFSPHYSKKPKAVFHNTTKIPADNVSYHITYLKMDKNNKENFCHVNPSDLEVGDTVLDPVSGKYHKVVMAHRASDGLCGGTYDASYFDTVELDQNLKKIENKHLTYLSFDTHDGQLQKHFVTLNE